MHLTMLSISYLFSMYPAQFDVRDVAQNGIVVACKLKLLYQA